MSKNNLSLGATYKQCRGCKAFFPDVSNGFNRPWTKATRAIVCKTLKDGAVFGDRLDYYGHHRCQHGTPAPRAKIYLLTPRVCSPKWRDPQSGLNIFKMPTAGTVAADDVLEDPQPDLVLHLAPANDIAIEEDSSSIGDNDPLLPPVLTKATMLSRQPPVPKLRIVVKNM